MARSLFLYVAMGQPVEFRVDEWHQLTEGSLIAMAPRDEELGYFIVRGRHSVWLLP